MSDPSDPQPYGQAGYPQPYGQPGYPPSGYLQPGYLQPGYPAPYQPDPDKRPGTVTAACVITMVLSAITLLFGLLFIGIGAAGSNTFTDDFRDGAGGQQALELGVRDILFRGVGGPEALDEEEDPREHQGPQDDVAAVFHGSFLWRAPT